MNPTETHSARRPIDPALASERFLERIPREYARDHLLLSQGGDGDEEDMCTGPGTPPLAVHNAAALLGVRPRIVVVDPEDLARAVEEAYAKRHPYGPPMPLNEGEETPLEDVDVLLAQSDQDLLTTQGKRHTVRVVDAILFDAVGRMASDVHVQPARERALVRYRIDGRLHTRQEISPHMWAAVVSRIKVMGGMDIAERRLPQDGRTTVRIGHRAIDLRISTFPTRHGERVVLRLLDTTLRAFDLGSLGMPDRIHRAFLDRARRPHGLVLVTGPTGSGKTTTLYATLRELATPEKNVMTIEDPVEYELATLGLPVSQSQVNEKKGVTFARGLRHLLRQDPDVILVGEIRDLETARMAVQASLTGHLVFATLHTNDAPTAVTRMTDLGVEPFLLGASLRAVLAQRLVRTLHGACRGRGCGGCHDTGFLGRTGVFELLLINEQLRGLVTRGAELEVLREAAAGGGFEPLARAAEDLVASGITSAEELDRVLRSD